MLLTVECLDPQTLRWRTLAQHQGVAPENAPMIVGVLRAGLPQTSILRWNWSNPRPAPFAPSSTRRGSRKRR